MRQSLAELLYWVRKPSTVSLDPITNLYPLGWGVLEPEPVRHSQRVQAVNEVGLASNATGTARDRYPGKQAVSLLLDADGFEWLKKDGDGYQTRANQMLRERMLAELNKAG